MRFLDALTAGRDWPDRWFVAVSVTAGIWEELLYRGFLIWFLLPALGTVATVIFSALIFGVGHLYQGRTGIIMTTVIGLAFAGLYVVTLSLWWLIAYHALLDIYSGTLCYRLLWRGNPRVPANAP